MSAEQTAQATEHVHAWKYVRTDASWWDGDEDDIYECACGEQQTRYIPR